MPQTEESLTRFIIGQCQCNCDIWHIGEQIVYTCGEYACYPLDREEEEKKDA